MAGVSINEIKTRIKSIENTMQITRAMELVSSSKLQKARKYAEETRIVQGILIDTMSEIRKDYGIKDSVFFTDSGTGKSIYVVMAGDRGLAGGFNNNLFRMIDKRTAGEKVSIIPIGKKALENYKNHGADVISDNYGEAAGVSADDCRKISGLLKNMYTVDNISRIFIAYNKFRSVIVQEPVIEQLLPFSPLESKKELTIYEPSVEDTINEAILQYLYVFIYSALCESIAAEHAARRNAMNAANKNGREMIENMRLKYNRARQSVITQELTEIIAVAEGL